jgi:hypothetical protein
VKQLLFILKINKEKLGRYNEDGTSKTVEVDESLFFKRKYNRGGAREQTWYIGGVERVSKKCFIVPVLRRNIETIQQVIVQNIYPGTRILTDEWRAYKSALRNLTEFTHLQITISIFLLIPLIRIYTRKVLKLFGRIQKEVYV